VGRLGGNPTHGNPKRSLAVIRRGRATEDVDFVVDDSGVGMIERHRQVGDGGPAVG
jgi:hypothetical protein